MVLDSVTGLWYTVGNPLVDSDGQMGRKSASGRVVWRVAIRLPYIPGHHDVVNIQQVAQKGEHGFGAMGRGFESRLAEHGCGGVALMTRSRTVSRPGSSRHDRG